MLLVWSWIFDIGRDDQRDCLARGDHTGFCGTSGACPASLSPMPARAGIVIAGNRPVADYISFTSIGHARRHDGALQMGTFTVCRRGQSAQKIVLANSGRVRLDVTGEACP